MMHWTGTLAIERDHHIVTIMTAKLSYTALVAAEVTSTEYSCRYPPIPVSHMQCCLRPLLQETSQNSLAVLPRRLLWFRWSLSF
jgi:hypothetical protein